MIDPNLLIHESDRAALTALKAIPGFTQVTKTFMKEWNEKQYRILNMSGRVRISEKQLPKYWHMLEEVAGKLEIETPDLYLEQNVYPNAYTYGENEPFIVITSGLLDVLPDELIPTVLAHECGHILCHHVLYRTIGSVIMSGALGGLSVLTAGLGSLLSVPLQMAFAYWMRCSEFSADRVAVLADGGSDKMVEVCMRLAGYSKFIDDEASREEFMKQALEYKEYIGDSAVNRSMEFMILSRQSHPLTAVRAYEADAWRHSDAFQNLVTFLEEEKNGTPHTLIPLDKDARSFIGRNADTVEQELRELGLTDIRKNRSIEKKNAGRGDILRFSIDGKDDFKECSWFTKDSCVELDYYQPLSEEEERAFHPNEIRMPQSERYYAGKDYKDVYIALSQLGFHSIQVEQVADLRSTFFTKENSVIRVLIGGKTFDKGEWYDPEAPILITYHAMIRN